MRAVDTAGHPDEQHRAGVAGGLAFAADLVAEVVLDTTREVHAAVGGRVFAALGGLPVVAGVHRSHDVVAATAYAGVGVGLRVGAFGLRGWDRSHPGRPIDTGSRGSAVLGALNGFLGDRAETSGLGIKAAARVDGCDIALERGALRDAYPTAGRRVAVLVHGLGETEAVWRRDTRPVHGVVRPDYSATLTAAGWTPVLLRLNTGLSVTENGAEVAALLDTLTTAWPEPVEQLALVGHSMGGLVLRASCAAPRATSWTPLVSDVVALGTPHLGAPLARGVTAASAGLARLPETAAFGRLLDVRAAGIRDLDAGLPPHVGVLEDARYRFVAASLGRGPRHPLGRLLGDLLVTPASATAGRSRRHRDVLHLTASHHFDLLNHPAVHIALRQWLSDPWISNPWRGGIRSE